MVELFLLLIAIGGLSLIFGLIYPMAMIFYYKIIKRSKKTIKQILKEI